MTHWYDLPCGVHQSRHRSKSKRARCWFCDALHERIREEIRTRPSKHRYAMRSKGTPLPTRSLNGGAMARG